MLRRKQWSVRLQWSRMPRWSQTPRGFRLHRGIWLHRGYPGPPGWGLGFEAEAYTKILLSCKIYIHSEKFMHMIMYYAYFNTNLFTLVCYRNILSTTAKAAAAVLFSLF